MERASERREPTTESGPADQVDGAESMPPSASNAGEASPTPSDPDSAEQDAESSPVAPGGIDPEAVDAREPAPIEAKLPSEAAPGLPLHALPVTTIRMLNEVLLQGGPAAIARRLQRQTAGEGDPLRPGGGAMDDRPAAQPGLGVREIEPRAHRGDRDLRPSPSGMPASPDHEIQAASQSAEAMPRGAGREQQAANEESSTGSAALAQSGAVATARGQQSTVAATGLARVESNQGAGAPGGIGGGASAHGHSLTAGVYGPGRSGRIAGAPGAARAGQGGTPAPRHGESEPLAAQVARGLLAAVRRGAQAGGENSATIRLHPEALGRLNLRVVVRESGVSARFEVSTPEAHGLLERSVDDLRAALEAKGLRVNGLEIERVQAQPVVGQATPSADPGPTGPGAPGGGGAGHRADANLGEGRDGGGQGSLGGTGQDGAARERDGDHNMGAGIELEAHRGPEFMTTGLIDAIA